MNGGSKISGTLIAAIVFVAALPLLFILPALTESPAAPVSSSLAKTTTGKSLAEPAKVRAPMTFGRSSSKPLPMPPSSVVAAPPVVSVPQPPAVVSAPLPQPPVALAPVPVAVPNPSGPEVMALEQRLSSLAYMVGKVDGNFDDATKWGITAFQKVEGLERTGRADQATLNRLQNASTPAPKFTTPPDHFEVDIPRQVVLVVRGGRVTAILPTSTGNNQNFTSEGRTRRAFTPNGQYQISFKRNGWRVAPLGRLYRPSYFNGGIAFHGSASVPNQPASKGCVRLPMAFADWFADNSPVGSVVYVYGGPAGENPQPVFSDSVGDAPSSAPAAPETAPFVPPQAAPPPAAPAPAAPNDLLGGLLAPN